VTIYAGNKNLAVQPLQVLANGTGDDRHVMIVAADFDSDGLSELLLSVDRDDTNGTDAGILYLYDEICDACPDDPNKTAPGVCGCGVPDTDSDGDGTPDCIDNCSCYNPNQTDSNNDGQGDVCDPILDSLTAAMDPVNINDLPINVSGTFSDCDDDDSHSAEWDWGDENTSPGTVDQGNNGVSGSHTYAEPGVYAVKLTVSDGYPASDEEIYEFVVIYDPAGGFVTGGGWIWSPEGAYAATPTLTGKAIFGFVSKYIKGASEPTGRTEFQFKAAGLNFHSSNYDWLVIAGANAKYKGVGTINGVGNYGFMLTATDANLTAGAAVDLFRIKIWDKGTGEVVYDNKMGADDDAYGGTELGGGSITIHKGK
jgi:hypothetical protein